MTKVVSYSVLVLSGLLLSACSSQVVDRVHIQQAEKKLRGLKSPSKVAKSIRQNARLYDRVVIGPDSLGDGGWENPRDGERGVAPHVRRGHLRSQAYGPQHSLRRPQWIQPTFVGGGGWGSGGVPSPSYVVR